MRLLDALVDDRIGRLAAAIAAGAHVRQAAVEKPHARFDVAAVMRTERENARGDAVLERRARGGDVARGERRRRRHAVIERRDEHRVQHPPDRRRRQFAHQQQIDGVGERQPAHHLVDGVAADQDLVRTDRCQRGLPSAAWRRRRPRLRASIAPYALCHVSLCARVMGLKRAVQSIAEIAETRHDVLLRVQLPIDDGRVDDDVRMLPLDERHAFGRGDDADDPDARAPARASRSSAATALPPVASIGSIISTSLSSQPRRQLRIVLRGDGRHLVALQADVADPRGRHQLENGVEHAEPGAQHWHDDDVAADRPPRGGPERRLDRHLARRQFAHCFGRQEHADPRRCPPKMLRRRRLIAERDERVVHERVIDDVNRHGRPLYNARTARTVRQPAFGIEFRGR